MAKACSDVGRWSKESMIVDSHAINGLGPAGKNWTLSSNTYANLHIRTAKEVICIGM